MLAGSIVEDLKPIAAKLGAQWANASGLTGIVEEVIADIDGRAR